MALIISTTNEILHALGQRLRAQRLIQGVAQHELAQMAGLSLGALRTLESSGRCSLETWVRVVQALGLVDEMERLFIPEQRTIAQMQQAEAARQRQRQRAPRRKPV